jgi:hypothetical protein
LEFPEQFQAGCRALLEGLKMNPIPSFLSGNPLLDVLIGMISIFLLASLMVTAAMEVIAQTFALRAKALREGIGKMLSEGNGSNLLEDFYKHPLIVALKTPSLSPGSVKATASDGTETTSFGLSREKDPSYISKDLFRVTLLNVAQAGQAAQAAGDSIQTAAKDNPQNQLLQALAQLAAQAKDTASFHKSIDAWFDGVMDRVSGAYKRKTQLITFALGLAVAAIMHIDAIRAYEYLAANPLRAAQIADQAARLSNAAAPFVTPVPAPAPEAATPGAANSAAKPLSPPALLNQKFIDDLLGIGLPIGWSTVTCKTGKGETHGLAAWWECLSFWGGLAALLGWLITALATTLGASFWFDTLKRFVSLRGSGKPPEEPAKA